MSGNGYKQKSEPTPRYVRFSSDSRHSNADIPFCADFVCLSFNSGRSRGLCCMSANDPKPKLVTLCVKLIKVGAKVVRHGRYVTFQMAEVAIPRTLFVEILRLIDGLRPAPLPP